MDFYTKKEEVAKLREKCGERIDLQAKVRILEIAEELIDSRGIDLVIKNKLKKKIGEYYDYLEDCRFINRYRYNVKCDLNKKEVEKLWEWLYDSFFNKTFLSICKEESEILVRELKSILRKARRIAVVTPNNKFNIKAYEEHLKNELDEIDSLMNFKHWQDKDIIIELEKAILSTRKEFEEILKEYNCIGSNENDLPKM